MQALTIDEIDNIRQSGFRPQVVGCFLKDKKILFLYKKEHDLWQLPQGGIYNRETIEKAIIREMSEELGEEFVNHAKLQEIIGADAVEFPEQTKGSRELKSDDGQTIFMKGKKYFFGVINTDILDLDINKTEFKDYKWLDFDDALALAGMIYQRGKKRITLGVLNKLQSVGLL